MIAQLLNFTAKYVTGIKEISSHVKMYRSTYKAVKQCGRVQEDDIVTNWSILYGYCVVTVLLEYFIFERNAGKVVVLSNYLD